MTAVDPVLAAVLQRRLKSITEEIGLTLLRTTRSPILNEARDFATGLYDAKGRMLEQTEYIPVLAFALQPSLEHVIRFFGDDIAPGDVILHNDVFSGGNQNNDVAVFRPVFHGGRLIAWSACKGHQADIGGAVRGGYNPEAREVWQEAFRIPPVKVYERGRLRRDVWDLIFANIRLRIVEEDIRAEIGGTLVGERGLSSWSIAMASTRSSPMSTISTTAPSAWCARRSRRSPTAAICGESLAFYDGVTPGSSDEHQPECHRVGLRRDLRLHRFVAADAGLRQRALFGDRFGADADLPDADQPGYPAQCRACCGR